MTRLRETRRFSTGALGFLLILLLLAVPQTVMGYDARPALERMARSAPDRVSYEQERHLSHLSTPLISRGELIQESADRLVKVQYWPSEERAVIEGYQLSVFRGSDHAMRRLDLSDEPAIRLQFDALRAVLRGDPAALEKAFTLSTQGTSEAWELELTPKEELDAGSLKSIILRGGQDSLTAFEVRERGGDHTVLNLMPIGSSQ